MAFSPAGPLVGDLVGDATLLAIRSERPCFDDEIGATLLTREGIRDREDNKIRYGARTSQRGELIRDAL